MSKPNQFDKQMSAVSFAEAGEHDTATQILNEAEPSGRSHLARPKKKPYLSMIIFGILSVSAYIIVFTNEKLVTDIYTMGGWHTLYPVGTAFLFSFIHGAFASNTLSVLGIEAKK